MTAIGNGAVDLEEGKPMQEQPKVEADGYLSVDEALERAPADIKEEDLEVWGGKIRVRGLTAAESARVKQVSIHMTGRAPEIVWAAMEMLQFEYGVVRPKFSADKVRSLHLSSGSGFKRVIDKIDELSGTTAEERKKAAEAFQRPGE
jgi:hypothetical protein